MKVSNKPSNPMPNAEGSKVGKAGAESILDSKTRAQGLEGADIARSARVDVSQRAQEIRKAKELATPDSGIDEAKVARLQKLIDSGEYKVNAEAIADRMLDEQMKMPL